MSPRGTSSPRRRGRAIALQALYEADTAHHSPEKTVERASQQGRLSGSAVSFGQELVEGVRKHREEIDALIGRHAPAWPVEQLPAIDRNILRIALLEMVFSEKTPRKVAINEAIELAKTFGGETSSKFVNGVLGSVAAEEDQKKPQV